MAFFPFSAYRQCSAESSLLLTTLLAAPPTAILTYGYWQRKFSADPSAVGKTIIVDGMARQIIGVHSAEFPFSRYAGFGLDPAAPVGPQ